MSTFEFDYQLLQPDTPALGRVAVIPWDSTFFGFPVGVYEAGDPRVVAAQRGDLRANLDSWSKANRVELVSCCVPGDHFLWHTLLVQAGFTPVDLTLRGDRALVDGPELPGIHHVLRRATAEDRADIERIAQEAFRFGRYRSDPRFPAHLASGRFRQWMANALDRPGHQDRVYVAGPAGKVTGFYHATLIDALADLRLAAVDRQADDRIRGKELYSGVLQALRDEGASRATGKISAANIPVLNIFAALHFRFSKPEAVFHWHAPGGPHLVSLDGIDSNQAAAQVSQ